MPIYGHDYFGFVYIWMDTANSRYYIGSHYGRLDDGYVCSNRWMKAAYKRRPQDFKRRVLWFLRQQDKRALHAEEERWLLMIKDHELATSKSVLSNTVRYYNMKRTAAGGNGKANLGKKLPRRSDLAFTWLVTTPTGEQHVVDRLDYFCREHNISKTPLRFSYKQGKPIGQGKNKGWGDDSVAKFIPRKLRLSDYAASLSSVAKALLSLATFCVPDSLFSTYGAMRVDLIAISHHVEI